MTDGDDLANGTCVPCTSDTPTIQGEELEELAARVPLWEVVEGRRLRRRTRFADFQEALEFVNRVGELAEGEGHHPDVSFGWGYAELEIHTHAVGGLTQNDFVLAAKVDRL